MNDLTLPVTTKTLFTLGKSCILQMTEIVQPETGLKGE